MSKISDLKFDDKNFNKHTQKGMSLLEESLQQFGAGRSILIDKNNNIIAGNGIIEAAGNVGLEDIQIVESDGKKIVAVKRTDIDLNSKEGRELALADNATAAADLSWDEDILSDVSTEYDFNPSDWIENWVEEPDELDAPEDEDKGIYVKISFKDSEEANRFLEEMRSEIETYDCTIMTHGGAL